MLAFDNSSQLTGIPYYKWNKEEWSGKRSSMCRQKLPIESWSHEWRKCFCAERDASPWTLFLFKCSSIPKDSLDSRKSVDAVFLSFCIRLCVCRTLRASIESAPVCEWDWSLSKLIFIYWLSCKTVVTWNPKRKEKKQ